MSGVAICTACTAAKFVCLSLSGNAACEDHTAAPWLFASSTACVHSHDITAISRCVCTLLCAKEVLLQGCKGARAKATVMQEDMRLVMSTLSTDLV